MKKVRLKWFGIFEGEEFIPFEGDVSERAALLEAVRKGDCAPLKEYLGDDVEVVHAHLPAEGEEYGRPSEALRELLFEVGRRRISEEIGPEDGIINAVDAIDEIDEAVNVLYARLRNWCGLYHPELYEKMDMEGYISAIAEGHFGPGAHDDGSIGVSPSLEDAEALRGLAGAAKALLETREQLHRYIEKRMRMVAPNTSEVAGPMLGARLLALAGGLRRLATLPASTVQLLGAEKALFRHLRTGKPPPKHGIIYLHPLVQSASPRERGKVARALAAKIAIAARVDYFGGEEIGSRLREELEKTFGKNRA